ncbi:Fatty acid/phospholipid synthesis protein PlsX [Herminiimonas arsenicoxydans]|uniref:Phosphate acyltransferase n=1 Tax=Herminiimonas arsenicoxydans TaxID=204773 RepID=PLSX_HERAR|nr:RecName: Full=Phosphate acyltransferase; AltName: Full=Acyl-ACP phosphotransacylase; AltName: Full=Acyl-[acyl-carrier-protein]--phosphate acyltransferase; AltName: Full=Phosphate-acyl-ACP acyltransferase [Herminiimonas arsenicoxydans]CAL62220.1 Fatty acid/phospholipid synthesis protein PlsX [Herminiimonas arsenicoxydans]
MTIKISIDCMGGDHGPAVTIPAAISFVESEPDAELILVGLADQLWAELKKHKAGEHPRLSVVNATEVVTMDDTLEAALRRKKNSSMRVAINLVKQGQADACVSAGNTGALMAISRYVLKTLPGVDRPAICSILPNQKDGPTYMLDLGANVDCEPQHLHQFALMGSALVSAMEGKPRPTVGLLNVGEEDIKGNDIVKQTAVLLRADHERGTLNFYGNVEGNDIFKGTTDIVVCDGFVGNVTLKASEGLGRFVKSVLTTEFKRNPLTMLGALIARSALKAISQRLNPSRYNGGSLLGLRGLVFKSHGGADAYGYQWAIKRAFDAAKYDVLARISTKIADLMPQSALTPLPEDSVTATEQ